MNEAVFGGMVFLLAVVTAYEMAIFSARPEHMRNASRAGDARGTIVMRFLRNPTWSISSLQIAATFLSLAIGSWTQAKYGPVLEAMLRAWGWDVRSAHQTAPLLIVLVSTVVVLVFANLIPKKLAYAYADPLSLGWARPAYLWVKATGWLASALAWFSDGILRVLHVPIPKAPPVLERDIEELLRQGCLVGTIDRRETDVIRHAFALSDTKVTDFMTPRAAIVSLRLDRPESAHRDHARASERSQFLVTEDGSPDTFVGVARARDLLADPNRPMREMVRPLLLLPASATALDLLRGFKEESARVALVVGDHGRVLGMATFNDLVSILVGEAKAIA